MKKKIVIIGGCGFIGLNVLNYLLNKFDYNFFVIDNLKGASSKKNLKLLRKYNNVNFIKMSPTLNSSRSLLKKISLILY